MSRITLGNFMTPNRLCENCRSGMSRPWTRASNMANGLLKKIALAGMVGASAMFGAKEAKAASMPWGVSTPATEILTLDDWGYPVNNYSVGRVNITNDADGSSLPSNYAWALIGTANFGGYEADVSVINGRGSNANGVYSSITGAENFFGSGNDSYLGVIDFDGDGNFGDYDPSTGEFVMDSGDRLMGNLNVGFNSGVLTVDGHYYNVPEPSSLTLLGVGAAALALPNGTNVIHFRIAVTNLSSFRLECRDSLTNAVWTSLGQYSVTGAVTEVSDTNTVPARFYRAVSP